MKEIEELMEVKPEIIAMDATISKRPGGKTLDEFFKEVKAKYVYGVTATPKRGDGLEKINYMLIGPIRYSYTAKEKVKEQGVQHLVYPRFTRTVPPRGVLTGKMHPNEAYEIIHNNDLRDEQIIEDVKNCVLAGRTPVVLSRYKDHSEKLYERLKAYADHVFPVSYTHLTLPTNSLV